MVFFKLEKIVLNHTLTLGGDTAPLKWYSFKWFATLNLKEHAVLVSSGYEWNDYSGRFIKREEVVQARIVWKIFFKAEKAYYYIFL